MRTPISWSDDAFWTVTTTESNLPDFSPYQIGNGRIGVRVGPMGIDWSGDAKPLLCQDGPDFWGKLNARLLMALGKHAYDGGVQLILPAWNQARLEIGGVEYNETNGRHHLRNILDLRDGRVACEDVWEYRPGKTAIVQIHLAVPRGPHPCAAWYEISLSGLTERATLRFGLNAEQIAESFLTAAFSRQGNTIQAAYVTRKQSRMLAQGFRWEGSGWSETGYEPGILSAWVSLSTDGADAKLTVTQSIHSSSDAPEPMERALADIDALDQTGRAEALAENSRHWHDLWGSGLNFQHENSLWERLVLLNQFHLLVNFDETGGYPLGPLGLSRPGWRGSQMWDADFWVFRGLLPLWPGLARSIIGFRHAVLPAARANAEKQGFHGTFFPWSSTDEGHDMSSAPYRKEIHNNVWIGLAAWEAAGTPPDKDYLAETAWPILEGVADFFVSRSTRDEDGSVHLRGVLPPDESVAEGHHTSTGTCDDNVLTNTGARAVLRLACEAARLLGKTAPVEWAETAERLVVLPPGPDGIIPEYVGYSGHTIKQADLILSFYPWRSKVDRETVLRNLEYYHGKTDRGGPLMTTQIEALLTMLHGDRENGIKHLFNEYLRYVRGPHMIPFETPANSNSIMLTGIGGLLQALIFGWYGATLSDTSAIPRIGCAGEPGVEKILATAAA